MIQSIFDAFASPNNSPNTRSNCNTPTSPVHNNVNMTPRAGRSTAKKTKSCSNIDATPAQLQSQPMSTPVTGGGLINRLRNEVIEKNQLIDDLQAKIQQLENEKLVVRNISNNFADHNKNIPSLIGSRSSSNSSMTTSPTPSSSTKSLPNNSVLSQVPGASSVTKKLHNLSTVSHVISERGLKKDKVGTRGSLLTTNILDSIEQPTRTKAHEIAENFLHVFQNPVDHITYLQSQQFASDLLLVSRDVSKILEEEPRCLFLQSPVYVFGDIHGNLEDLHFFSDNIWRLGMDLTAGQFLFLGDYVDRGMSCLECIAYLFGLKILYPRKISLLRGNHETRDVNGWEDHYVEKSFLYQCKDRFGKSIGEAVWEECNLVFDRLPLSAIIDHDIFCIHGGIPRPIPEHETEIQSILAIPKVASVMPSYEYENEWMQQVATDCIWSDPAPESMEPQLDDTGFGDSPRGGGAVMFGSAAIDNFLASNNLSYIIRAHEAHAQGVALSKGARVFTVFSTSKDHRQGGRAMAGCILVDTENIQVINRSHKYKNKYVHRRISVENSISATEWEQRKKLGLVRLSAGADGSPNANPAQKLDHYFPSHTVSSSNKENCGNSSSNKYTNNSFIPMF